MKDDLNLDDPECVVPGLTRDKILRGKVIIFDDNKCPNHPLGYGGIDPDNDESDELTKAAFEFQRGGFAEFTIRFATPEESEIVKAVMLSHLKEN